MKKSTKAKMPIRASQEGKYITLPPAALTLLCKAFGIPVGEAERLLSISPDQVPTTGGLVAVGSWATEILAQMAAGFETIKRRKSNSADKDYWSKQETEYDDALGVLMRNSTFKGHFRAQRSNSSELLVWAIGDVVRGMKRLPALLKQYESFADPIEFAPNESDTFSCQLVESLIELLHYFEEQCEQHPERFRLLARELPHWPFLVTQHRAGYKKRFDKITSGSFVSLGTECPLDTSPNAMYRLQTPVCGLLWEEIFQDWINVSAGVRAVRRFARERNQPVNVKKEVKEIQSALEHCCESEAERKIFDQAFSLPELRKSTARDWANKFVIPYLHLKFPNWQEVPALQKYIGKKGGHTLAEKEIRRAVVAMARR